MSESSAISAAFSGESTVWQCPADPDQALTQAKAFLAEQSVHYLLVQFVDLHGGIKSKSVPVASLEGLTKEGAGFAGAAVLGFDMTPQSPELMLRVDLTTLRLMLWMPGYACIRGTALVNDTPYELDPRNLLKTQTERLSKRGWRLMTGLEPEFYLLKKDDQGAIVPFDDSDNLDHPTYDYRGITRNAGFIEGLHQSLNGVGLNVYQIDHEDANGQFEMNFDYDEAVASADNMQLFKMAAREIAHREGAIASFLPKLSATTTGNGMHVHCSLVDAQGHNLFHDDSDSHGMGLSPLAYHFIAGVLTHAQALCALLCPSVNSYKRLRIGTPERPSWAPVFIAYGDNNRSAMVRIPYGRLEVRIGDSAMNPYLATAAIIAAGLDGIDRELVVREPNSVNFYELSSQAIDEMGVDRLPETLKDAIDALDYNQMLREALGNRLIDSFVALKRAEWQQYHSEVSEWEIQRYLDFY